MITNICLEEQQDQDSLRQAGSQLCPCEESQGQEGRHQGAARPHRQHRPGKFHSWGSSFDLPSYHHTCKNVLNKKFFTKIWSLRFPFVQITNLISFSSLLC